MQNYHKHDSFSNLFTSFKDSHMMSECGAYIDRAVELGHRVVSTVNHGSQGNYLRIWESVQKRNESRPNDQLLKYVFGTEAYWVPDRHQQDNSNAHIILLARNKHGVYEINSALSEANDTGFYYVPRVDLDILHRLNPENVLVTTACVAFWGKVDKETGGVNWHRGGESNSDSAITDSFLALRDHFGSSLYLEVQNHNTSWQKIINRKCLDLHYKHNIPIICGLDSHYVHQAQFDERRYLREESGVHMRDEDHELSSDVYEDYPDDQTVVHRFQAQSVLNDSEIRQAMQNTDVMLAFDDIAFDRSRKLPTIYPDLSQDERNALYERRVWDAWNKVCDSSGITERYLFIDSTAHYLVPVHRNVFEK